MEARRQKISTLEIIVGTPEVLGELVACMAAFLFIGTIMTVFWVGAACPNFGRECWTKLYHRDLVFAVTSSLVWYIGVLFPLYLLLCLVPLRIFYGAKAALRAHNNPAAAAPSKDK